MGLLSAVEQASLMACNVLYGLISVEPFMYVRPRLDLSFWSSYSLSQGGQVIAVQFTVSCSLHVHGRRIDDLLHHQ